MAPLPLQASSAFPITGELQSAVSRLLSDTSASTPQPLWLEMIVRIAASLQAEPQAIAPFVAAWRALYTVTLCLDHLQDGDDLGDPWLANLPPAMQYHLAFSTYIAAQHALAQLDERAIPAPRIVRLQRFWATSVAQLASGQYRDLAVACSLPQVQGEETLNEYEQLAAQKTGATFALAFGGVALLATDDEVQIAALTTAGTVYGMLLQYQDDLIDSAAQERQPTAATLNRALLATHPALAVHRQGAVEAFWAAIYAGYAQALEGVLTPLPAETRRAFADLLRCSFGEPAAPVEAS
jgi:hypothetical protein